MLEVQLFLKRWILLGAAFILVGATASFAGEAKWIVPQTIARQRKVSIDKPATKPTGVDPLENTWTCYRMSFDLPAAPAWSTVRIAADTKYWLWVNGELAVFDGGLMRGPTRTD